LQLVHHPGARLHHPVPVPQQLPQIPVLPTRYPDLRKPILHDFRTKRQLWAYSGFAVETHDSGEYRFVRGKLVRNRERITVRGLNDPATLCCTSITL
jgi:hypothetical protein